MLAQIVTAAGAGALAAGGAAYASLWPTSQIFGRTIVAGDDPNQIALTFDDGPNDPETGQLLDLLAERGVRATFFLIGNFVRQRPDIARSIAQAGHLLGNHTMTHPLLATRSPAEVRRQLAGCTAAIEDATGVQVRYFRPPHGGRRPDVLRIGLELGLTAVQWNVTAMDWKPIGVDGILRNVDRGIAANRRAGRGSNILLHDGGQAGIGVRRADTVAATRQILDRYADASFVTPDVWDWKR